MDNTIVYIIVIIGFYFLPTIAAYVENKKNKEAIFCLNLMTGWTILGWIIAAVWASCKDDKNIIKVQGLSKEDLIILEEIKNQRKLNLSKKE